MDSKEEELISEGEIEKEIGPEDFIRLYEETSRNQLITNLGNIIGDAELVANGQTDFLDDLKDASTILTHQMTYLGELSRQLNEGKKPKVRIAKRAYHAIGDRPASQGDYIIIPEPKKPE